MGEEKYRVAIFCPDRHIQYDIRTLNRIGVGGGVTARIRIAHALARQGHEVHAYINCPRPGYHENVHYHDFAHINNIETDILIASTSGGELDLRALAELNTSARLRILMVHGVDPPLGLEELNIDYIYALSNFIQRHVATSWNQSTKGIFVTHRGVSGEFFEPLLGWLPRRHPFRILYVGHPSKGLDSAMEVVRVLRQLDRRFQLHIYGGAGLWGETESRIRSEPGFIYHGLIGQSLLARRMQAGSFCINLQERQEPFGMVVIEAMRAGCIVLASSVGAYPEIIKDGWNGYLVPGHPTNKSTRDYAACLIKRLVDNPDLSCSIRRNATAYPLDWSIVAQSWSDHWEWILNGKKKMEPHIPACTFCGAEQILLADGVHCTECGCYQNSRPKP